MDAISLTSNICFQVIVGFFVVVGGVGIVFVGLLLAMDLLY